jgi:hypothetical protein
MPNSSAAWAIFLKIKSSFSVQLMSIAAKVGRAVEVEISKMSSD